MDAGIFTAELPPVTLWGLGCFAAAVAAGGAALWLGRRRAAWRWSQAAHLSGLSLERTDLGPCLSGVYRGRAIRVGLRESQIQVDVRAANRARILDEVHAGGPVPEVPWITAFARSELSALATHSASSNAAWSVTVADRNLALRAAPLLAQRPEQVRFLLDLACDLADGVDAIGGTPISRFAAVV